MKRSRYRTSPAAETSFRLNAEYITLGQLIKFVGAIDTGGAAKSYLAEAGVLVNGQPEERRGRKLYAEDLVSIPGGPSVRIKAAAVKQDGQPGDTQ